MDWYFKIDADEEAGLLCEPEELLDHLSKTKCDVGTAHIKHEPEKSLPRMYRSIPGLKAINAEEYEAPDGRLFGGDPSQRTNSEWLPIEIDHSRHDMRSPRHKADKYFGYELMRIYNLDGADPCRPPGMPHGCRQQDSPDGCGHPECPTDFRRRDRPGHFRDCTLGRELERKVEGFADGMAVQLGGNPLPKWNRAT